LDDKLTAELHVDGLFLTEKSLYMLLAKLKVGLYVYLAIVFADYITGPFVKYLVYRFLVK